jgi:fucose permease
MIFASAAETSFSGWVYSYALHARLAGEAAAGVITSAFWGAMTLGRLVSVCLIRRLGSRRLLFASCAGSGFSMFFLVAFPGNISSLWFTVILVGLFQAPLFPTAFAFAGERKILSGGVAGLLVAASSLGSMTIPPLAGRLLESIGAGSFPLIIAAAQILAFLALLGVLKVPKNAA